MARQSYLLNNSSELYSLCHQIHMLISNLFLCSKCARCILSIEFHQLSDQDAFKLAFRAALDCIPSRLNGLAVSQQFIALSTLTYHQWSHPTLMALMKGEVVDEQTGMYLYCSCLHAVHSSLGMMHKGN